MKDKNVVIAKRIISAALLEALLLSTGCGMQIGTVQYWEQYNKSLKEANTAQREPNREKQEATWRK